MRRMKRQENRSSKLFLIELIMAIFFFSVIATICVQLFSEAHAMSVHSKELVQSVNLASNVAEAFRVWDGQKKSWQAIYPEGEWDGTCWQISYDENWQPTNEQVQYLLFMELFEQDELHCAQIVVSERENEQVIYELTVKRGR